MSRMRISATARPASRALLSPDELRELAEAHVVLAMRTARGAERLRILTFADALIDVAETKKLLLR